MFGMQIKTFMYGTPSGVYTMDVHENCDCADRSYHISSMMSSDPIIQDGTAIEVRISRLEGVVTAMKVADRHFVVEMRMPWDSIESDVLTILGKQLDLAFLVQNLSSGQNRRRDKALLRYFSQHDPHWAQQPDAHTGRDGSDTVVSAGSLYGSLEHMVSAMDDTSDKTTRGKY